MSGRTILNVEKPTTQTVESVKSLLSYVGLASDPLPSDVSLDNGRLVLILSNKKDCYYVVTAAACSCPANTWHPGQPCKHQRKHFPVAMGRPSTTSEPLVKRGGFKPVDALPSEEKARAAPLYVGMHDTTLRDVAYHLIKADREMWPCEA